MAKVLRGADRILVTGHPEPDGDVAGCGSALHCALTSLGKDVVLFNPDPFPPGFRHLPGASALVHELPDASVFDVTVILDAGDPARVEPFLPPITQRGTVLWIDHHPRSGRCGDLEWVDMDAAAVGEMLHALIQRMGVPIGRDVGMGLYASLLADTGGFRYQATSSRMLRLAADLLDSGVRPWEVAEQVYEREPVERIRLLTRVLQTLHISPSGRCASIVVSLADLASTGATVAMTDGMINHARGIDGVEIAAQFEELPEREGWRVTLRSRGSVDVREVAALLSTTGHRFWACYSRTGALDVVREELVDAVDRALSRNHRRAPAKSTRRTSRRPSTALRPQP